MNVAAYVVSGGDCPNLEVEVNTGGPGWKTVKQKDGWQLQRNLLTGHSRIVDDKNIRRAWGAPEIMEEKFRRLTRKEFLEPGDVIGISRKKAMNIYEHYAVYTGNGMVIHYAGSGSDFEGKVTIHEAPIEEFLKSDTDYFVLHFDAKGTSKPIKIYESTRFAAHEGVSVYSVVFKERGYHTFSAEETVRRARSRVGEENYNLVTNNCEHFAIWCKTGVAKSYQVKKVTEAMITPFLLEKNL